MNFANLKSFFEAVSQQNAIEKRIGGEMYLWPMADKMIECAASRGIAINIVGGDEHVAVIAACRPLAISGPN